MSNSLFIQIHTLTSYPASLLNRDDVGFAKRVPFGGATRTRISSQCLKRHWRRFEGEHSLRNLQAGADPVDLSVRSRLSFERFVKAPLIEEGVPSELAHAATEAVMAEVLGESAKAKRAKEESANGEGKGEPNLQTGQITVLGKPELSFFLQEARALVKAVDDPKKVKDAAKRHFTKDWARNLQGLKRAAGLDAALFGRMVTSDKLSRADAAVHVAHAFTVHAEQAEPDYFSAVDDLTRGGDAPDQLGSGHIGTTELTSGLFYGYVVVDVPQLISNLEGVDPRSWRTVDRKLGADVINSLVHLVTRVSPGAKLGSTAPYAYAHLVMAETGASQPRTLANAFLKPVRGDDMVAAAFEALAGYLRDVDQMYGLDNQRALAAVGPREHLAPIGTPGTVDDVARAAARAVVEG